MGILRLLLAISVVLAHSNINALVGGQVAVQLFYIISGFLISFIINTNPVYKNPIKFYANRVVRIYPIYISIALISLFALVLANPKFMELYASLPLEAIALLIFVNIFIFGQDLIMFTAIENNHLAFSTNFRTSSVLVYRGLVVPQAWTLGLELTFYLIAPFILRNTKIVLTLLFLSLTLRALFIHNGLGFKDPWTYRFFPLELSLFLLGSLSHKFLLPTWQKILKGKKSTKLEVFSTVFLITLITFYAALDVNSLYKGIFLYVTFLFLLPLTFLYQKGRKLDKLIGDLSYPVYICHFLIIWVIAFFCKKINFFNHETIAIMNVLISIGVAVILNATLGKRFDTLRNKIRLGKIDNR